MYRSKWKLYSQNLLQSHRLAEKLVRNSSIANDDFVIEIGPGQGIITQQLIRKASRVIAIELDPDYYQSLQAQFYGVNNLTIYQGNFLDFPLPTSLYKVFANIPFSIEGKVIRKLINAKNPPLDCYLVVRKTFGERLAAIDRENMFSIMHKPWFDFSIYHYFRNTDFTPKTKVEAVMLRFTKRNCPILDWNELTNYQQFIRQGFGQGLPILHNLKNQYGYHQTIRAMKMLKIPKNSYPSQVNFEQWNGLYQKFWINHYK